MKVWEPLVYRNWKKRKEKYEKVNRMEARGKGGKKQIKGKKTVRRRTKNFVSKH
jgi:hypothetical protein